MTKKLLGKTLAESLGIQVPDDAPGGQALLPHPEQGAQRSTRGHKTGAELAYDGFADLDGYGRND